MPNAVDYPTLSEPATPEYVLALFADGERLDWLLEPEGEEFVPTFDTTVRQWVRRQGWLYAPLHFDWRGFAEALNSDFGVSVPMAEWEAVLTPPRERTLRGVCELIARHARRPVARPYPIFGCDGRAAGAFLTVRSILAGAGADVSGVAPSTKLAAFAPLLSQVPTLTALIALAPGALPDLVWPGRLVAGWRQQAFEFALLASPICVLAGVGLQSWPVGLAGCAAVSATAAWAMSGRSSRPRFGELRTFRDLAHCLVAGTV